MSELYKVELLEAAEEDLADIGKYIRQFKSLNSIRGPIIQKCRLCRSTEVIILRILLRLATRKRKIVPYPEIRIKNYFTLTRLPTAQDVPRLVRGGADGTSRGVHSPFQQSLYLFCPKWAAVCRTY